MVEVSTSILTMDEKDISKTIMNINVKNKFSIISPP